MNDSMQPLVSIRCCTYNHAPYIRQCLDGFVMQKTNFKFEAIVHDDASTDGTADIVREYASKYPDIIKPIYETENQYSKQDGSLSRIMNAAVSPSAKYIALCEGDDYWTDPYKLQKQVDFLETNPEYSLCCGKSRVYVQKTNKFTGFKGTADCETLDCILKNYNDVNTSTAVIRKKDYEECKCDLAVHLPNRRIIDTLIWYWFAYRRSTRFIDETFSVYRVLENSACHTSDSMKRISLDLDFIRMKIEFIGVYVEDPRQRLEYLIGAFNETSLICDYAVYLGCEQIRKTRTYQLGSFLLNCIRWKK